MDAKDIIQTDKDMQPEEALNYLLEHIDEYERELKLDIFPFNPFDVLQIARTEIRHSNVLSWLLDPSESHGIRDAFILKFIKIFAKNHIAKTNDSIRLHLMDCSDFKVYREKDNIDILAVSEKNKMVICIENKIDTNDHNGQLNKYSKIVNSTYNQADYSNYFIYLTPDGRMPIEPCEDNWYCLSYKIIVDTIKSLSDISIKEEVKSFIKSYRQILEREIMENKDIIDICERIYSKHKQAIDLIIDNRPDKIGEIAKRIQLWCEYQKSKDQIIYDKDRCNKWTIRFKTSYLDKLFPDLKAPNVSGFNSQSHYYYEIALYEKKSGDIAFFIRLSFSSQNLPDDQKNIVTIIDKLRSNKRVLKADWLFRSVLISDTIIITESTELPDIDESFGDFVKEKSEKPLIYQDMDGLFNKVRNFEDKIKKELLNCNEANVKQ